MRIAAMVQIGLVTTAAGHATASDCWARHASGPQGRAMCEAQLTIAWIDSAQAYAARLHSRPVPTYTIAACETFIYCIFLVKSK
jgi:hypothetical protein